MFTSDIENIGIGRRLAKLMGQASIPEVAEIAGTSPNSLRRWIRGEVAADARALAKICLKFNCSLMWLVTGVGDEEGRDQVSILGGAGYAPVPVIDIAASAGPGRTALDSEPASYMGFQLNWLRGLVSDTDRAMILKLKGDSMEPDFKSGDDIMVDLADAGERVRDGVYVMRLNDQLLVKRLRMLGAEEAQLVSANPAYDPITVNLATDDFRVVGRVVWSGRVLV
jgi:phage repressor protein C with HTH and peptisase S24 domain